MKRLNNSYPYQKQLKNRSSKHLIWLTGVGTKSIVRCVSNEVLQKWVDNRIKGAVKEQTRRHKKADKKMS